jgi:hypothetical protein
MVRAILGINLSTDVAGDPISLSPDLWYGVNDKLTVGLVHSFVGETGIMGIPGTSLCISGDACADVYNGFGLDARYTLKSTAKLAVAFEGGLIGRAIDPFTMVVKLGAVGRYRVASKVAIDFQPNVFIGLTEREPNMNAGNKEVLTVPVTAVFAVTPKVGVLAQLGLVLPFAESDFYLVPFSIGGTFAINQQFSAELAFTLTALTGGEGVTTGTDARALSLGGVYAF